MYAAHPAESLIGWRAAGVPGTVAGLALAHKRYGKLPWRELVAPAIKLARDGHVVSDYVATRTNTPEVLARLKQFPESWRLFANHHAGDRVVQPELAKTLARIANDPTDFYRGEIAKRIVAQMKGSITAKDLAQYKPTIRTPLRGTYRGYEIITMPPPSSGGIALIEMLNMLDPYDVKSMGWQSASEWHTLLEVMRRAYADRAQFLGDTDFVSVPVKALTSRAYTDARRRDIDPNRASDSKSVGAGNPAPYESQQTTHFVIVDRDGMVVTNTYTLNDSYGSAVTIEGAGFLMNDEMDDFTTRPGVPNLYGLVQGAGNAIAPKKRPLSSMVPAIVLKDGKPFLVTGAAGGATIITAVLENIINVIDFGMDAQQAVDAPRMHHQWLPDEVAWETNGVSPDTRRALEAMGYVFHPIAGPFSAHVPEAIADAPLVVIAPDGTRFGGADPRRGAAAAGW
jgi:gamma-glutamyltranspeptidase/glutathione hydrolase